jgi:hypothetical protein
MRGRTMVLEKLGQYKVMVDIKRRETALKI